MNELQDGKYSIVIPSLSLFKAVKDGTIEKRELVTWRRRLVLDSKPLQFYVDVKLYRFLRE